MSVFSVSNEHPLKLEKSKKHSGISILEFVPFYNPTVLIFDRDKAYGVGSGKLGEKEPKKGVYVLVETEPTQGRYSVSVGLGGLGQNSETDDGEQQTLLGRVKYHASNPPLGLEKWSKAILVCDWETDIKNRSIEIGSVATKSQNTKIIKAMQEEVHLLEKLLHNELKKYIKGGGSLIVHRNEDKGFNHFMPNPDNERFEYYIGVAMESLRCIGLNYDEPRTRKGIETFIKAGMLAVGESVYGAFNSQAIIKNDKGNAEVKNFLKKTAKANKKDLLDLQNVSLHKARLAIYKANEMKGNVPATKFWHVFKDGKFIKIEDLEE